MHCDESVLADKSGTLLEEGRYKYDPREFHGPTLHYLTLLPARLQGVRRYVDMNEVTLRSVPASAGALLVASHFLLLPVLGPVAAISAALLSAVSPAMVYYSRYYIHETLLVFFTFGALISICRYLRQRSAGWAMAAGAFLGLVFATKETSIIVAASLGLGLVLSLAWEKWRGETSPPLRTLVSGRHLLLAFLAAALISMALFSSFLGNPRGIIDSVTSIRIYVERAGSSSIHAHPWYYYLALLLYFHGEGGPYWSEGFIIFLAVFGFASALGKTDFGGMDRRMLRFIGFYTLLMIAMYSAIPHKTPWCLLGFLHGLILMAGAGIVRLLQACRTTGAKRLIPALLAVATVHLGWQAWAGSYRFDSDPRNPYVYAHTSRDVYEMVRRVEGLAGAHPAKLAMPIQIISRENLWPLPWYLRRFSDIGWWNGVPDEVPSAPLILATPDMEPALVRKLYDLPPPGERELYMNIFDRVLELRPQVEIRGYAAKTLWDEYRRQEAAGSLSPPLDTR